MKIFNKKFVKFAAIFAVIIILAAGAVWLLQYYNWRKSPEYQAQKYIDEMTRKYQEDTYGGSTPEETLQLFIDALKKSDIDLAAKYFVVDKQEEWKEKLERVKEGKKLQDMTSDLSRDKEKQILSDNHIVFYIYNDDNLLAVAIDIIKSLNNKWKIESL